ncbi:Ig-like domain-containing protein [Saltatorellus ferox]|uniref:Ig-like domain-containing protein n=1 Tax=Saltatorellus ferox TaxID=2528018 RepID=UPI003AF3AC23
MALTGCSGSDSQAPTPDPVTLSGTLLGPGGSAVGATVQLSNASGSYATFSNHLGEYSLNDVPQGTYELLIDGSTVIRADGSKASDLASLRASTFVVEPGAVPFGESFLTLPEVGASLPLSLDVHRQAVIPSGTELRVPAGGPALRFVQTTIVTFPEGTEGPLSISDALPGSIPVASLESDQAPVGGLILQPAGVTFDVDPVILLPNTAGLPPNTAGVNLVGFGSTGTERITIGTGTVDPEGRYIVPDSTLASSPGESAERGTMSPSSTGSYVAATRTSENPTVTVTGTLRDSSGGTITNAKVLVSSRSSVYQVASDTYSAEVTNYGLGGLVNVMGDANGFIRDFQYRASTTGDELEVDLVFHPANDVPGRPFVTATFPAEGAVGVSRNSVIRVQFNESMDPTSLQGLVVQETSGLHRDPDVYFIGFAPAPNVGDVLGTRFAEQNSVGSLFGLIPVFPLKADTEYSIVALTLLTDLAGESLFQSAQYIHGGFAYEVVSTFTTGSTDPGAPVSITCSPGTATTINRYETLQATANVTETSTSSVINNAPVTWSSSDVSVASVSSTGLIDAYGSGTTTITASASGETASFELTVAPLAIDRVELSLGNDHPLVGKTVLAAAQAYSATNAPFQQLRYQWSSSNTGVATVGPFGEITAIAPGTSTISVHAVGDASVATRVITVHARSEVDGIELSNAIDGLEVGDTGVFASTVMVGSTPVAGAPVTFASSNPAALRIDASGLTYRAVAPGIATITATAELGATDFTREFVAIVYPVGVASAQVLGAAKAADPSAGASVFRHHVSDGSFAESVTTDSTGLALFSDVSQSTMSFSLAETAGNTTRLRSFLGVRRALTTVSGGSTSAAPIVQLDANGGPTSTDYMTGSSGRFAYPETFWTPAMPASILGVSLAQQQADGLVSAFAAVQDSPSSPVWAAPSDAPSAAGFALDLNPSTLDGTTVSVTVDGSALSTIPFATESQLDMMAPAGGAVRRKGVIFSQRSGVGSESTSGQSTLAFPLDWTDAYLVHEHSGSSRTRQYTTLRSIPTSPVQVSSPDLILSGMTWLDGTLSWTLGGTDASSLDIGQARVVYTTATGKRVEWTSWFSPNVSSIKVPGLPASMSDVLTSYDLVEYELELFAIDGVSGFPAAISAIGSSNGSLEQALLDLQTEAHSVYESGTGSGGGGGGSTDYTLSFTISIFGSGTVTADTGSGPVSVADGDVLTLPENTLVTVTATGTNGSVVQYFEVPGYFSFDGNTTESATFTMTSDSFVTVEIQ